jgi:molybdopterin/thiamine biosynthesis adenylyltransferase
MVNLDRQRFERLYPSNIAEATKVVLIGCGGIGSYTASILARMGIGEISLIDFDKVEEINVATQDLPLSAIGQFKVDAVVDRITGINPDVYCTISTKAFKDQKITEGNVIIPAVDSIEVRQEVYKAFEKLAMPGTLLIDPRMGAESFELWVVRKGSEFEAEYKRSLFDPTPRPELPCGAKAIAYTGAFAGSLTASAVRRATMSKTWETWVAGDVGTMRMAVLREIS